MGTCNIGYLKLFSIRITLILHIAQYTYWYGALAKGGFWGDYSQWCNFSCGGSRLSFLDPYLVPPMPLKLRHCKYISAYQPLEYNSLMWYTWLPVRHGLPNPIVVCTNERTCSLSSVITKLSYMFSHWFRPHVGLAIHANLRGWVNCTQFQQNSLISGHVFCSTVPVPLVTVGHLTLFSAEINIPAARSVPLYWHWIYELLQWIAMWGMFQPIVGKSIKAGQTIPTLCDPAPLCLPGNRLRKSGWVLPSISCYL